MSSREMTLLEHIEELRARVVRILVVVVVISVFVLVFRIDEVRVGDYTVYAPYPDPFHNIAVQVIQRINHDLVPEGVTLIQIAPGQAFFAQIYVAIFLGVLIGMPFIVRELSAFINPALYPHERRMILRLVLPATSLFVSGAVFSYLLATPFTLAFLYQYGVAAGAQTLITIMDLITFVLQFTLGFGLAFQLPILMWVLTQVGVVGPGYWRENARYAVVAIVVFGAIITPDGSGITMWFVALPMILLYMLGYVAVRGLGTEGRSKQGRSMETA